MVYFFAFIGMLCWGVSPIFAKLGLKDINPLVGLSVRTFFTATAILIWLLLSGGITELKDISSKALFLLVLEAILATLIGDLAYFAALKQGSPAIVMLIMACSPVVTILTAVLFLGEKLTLSHLIGACLAMIGIILIV
ncbi:EamA family transporter [Oscillospiraceae bacterium WX1]